MTLLNHDIMTTLNMIYSQFWAMNPHCLKDNFHSSNCMKVKFYIVKKVGDGDKVVPTLLSTHNLDLYIFFQNDDGS
jgi:hypothetical protein